MVEIFLNFPNTLAYFVLNHTALVEHNIWVGFNLAHKYKTKVEIFELDKPTSLLCPDLV